MLEGKIPAEDLELVQGYVEQLKVRVEASGHHQEDRTNPSTG